MKLATNDVPVEFGGQVDQGEFRIKNSAVAFSILSSGLYSNKYKAILRELGCNAYDSHVEAGYPEKPFTVHLPTRLNPIFSVRDYGIGLSHEQVMNLYTTYFESTKNNSNDFVGCMGLGSKSPFSYTKNFTITAIKDGTKGVYSAFIGDRGVPNILQLTSEATDDHNGVEVSFAVENRNDMSQFKTEAAKVYKWFKTKPEITGEPLTIPEVKYTEENIIDGASLLDSNGYYRRDGSRAIMGNVAYPINIPEGETLPEGVADLFNKNRFIIRFNIGDLDIAASREELGYVPQTIAALAAKAEEIMAALEVYVNNKLKPAKNKWERNLLAKQLIDSNDELFSAIVGRYLLNNPKQFVKGTEKSYARLKIIVTENELCKVDGMKFTMKSVRKTYQGNVSLANVNAVKAEKPKHLHTAPTPGTSYNPNNQWPVYQLSADDTTIVFNDETGNVLHRIRKAFESHDHKGTFSKSNGGRELFILQAQNKAVDKTKILSWIKRRFPGATIVLASQLPALETIAGSNGNTRITVQKFKDRRRSAYGNTEQTFDAMSGKIKDIPPTIEKGKKKVFLYLKLSHKSVMMPFGTESWSATKMFDLMNNSDIAKIAGIDLYNVYGVNKTSLKDVTADPNWVDFFEYAEKVFNEIDWKKAREETEYKIIAQQFENSEYKMSKVRLSDLIVISARDTAAGKMFAKWHGLVYNSKTKTTTKPTNKPSYDMFIRVMQIFFPNKDFTKTEAKIDVTKIEESYNTLFQDVKNTYPMLGHLSLSTDRYNSTKLWEDAINYINLVDSVK